MRTVKIIFGALAVSIISSQVHAACKLSRYIDIVETKFDTRCSKSKGSLWVVVESGSNQRLHAEICLEQKDGDWDCGQKSIDSGETFGYWACSATGRVHYRGAYGDTPRSCLKNVSGSGKPIGDTHYEYFRR